MCWYPNLEAMRKLAPIKYWSFMLWYYREMNFNSITWNEMFLDCTT